MVARLPLLVRPRQLDRVLPQQLGQDLLHLDHADVAADALAAAAAEVELEHAVHLFQPRSPVDVLCVVQKPAFRAEDVRVRPEDDRVPVRHPRVDADDGAAGEEMVAAAGAGHGDGDALGGHVAFHQQPDGRVDAHGLLEHGVEVRQAARRLLVRDDRRAELPCPVGRVDLLHHPRHALRVAAEVVDHRPQRDRGRVASCLRVPCVSEEEKLSGRQAGRQAGRREKGGHSRSRKTKKRKIIGRREERENVSIPANTLVDR